MGTKSIAESRLKRNGLARGDVAPDFRLPTPIGGDLELAEFRGSPVLLVFSDPGCGPCMALAPELERAHRALGDDVQIVMVSRGDAAVNRAKIEESNLTFPVVLQHGWSTSRDYGMFATPIAYLIDEHGVIAADVAVGVDPILALLQAAHGDRRPDAMESRLAALRVELEKGRAEVERLEAHRTYLHDTMLRISGAIQVLEELSAPSAAAGEPSLLDVIEPSQGMSRASITERVDAGQLEPAFLQ